MHPPSRATQENLFTGTNKAVESGVVEATNTERRKLWRLWTSFLDTNYPSIQHDLSNIDKGTQSTLLGAYAQYVRLTGRRLQHSPGKTRTQTIELALRAVSQTLLLDGKPSPVVTAQGTYPLQLKRQLDSYRKEDPPPRSKLALPFSVLGYLHSQISYNTPIRQRATTDLAIIAWFYLLQVGKYTNPRTGTKQTVPLRLCDVTLWRHNTKLSQHLPLAFLLDQCTSATLHIDNQKNGKRNSAIHHEATREALCPVKSLIRRICHIRAHTTVSTTPISTYYPPTRPSGWRVTANDINKLLKNAVSNMGLSRYNISPDDISSHSLRAGGAMALHLNGVPSRTIQLLGRWSSDTFLIYIHEQIAAFSTNLSTLMSTNITYHNIHINPTMRTIV